MLARGIWVDEITASYPDIDVGDKERFQKEWKLWQEDCDVPKGTEKMMRPTAWPSSFTVAVGRNIDGAKLRLVAGEGVDDVFLGLPQDGSTGDGDGLTHIPEGVYEDAIVNTVDGQQFFVARSGCIGRGPLGLRVGDAVAVLPSWWQGALYSAA